MALVVGGTTVTGTQTVLASVLTGTASAINGSNITSLPAPSSANVGTGNSGLGVGAVGTWAFLRNFSGGNIGTGGTTAGSGLKYAAANGQEASAASGTWRCMGIAYTGDETGTTVWLRTA
tara:strand:- start:1216 stop:1575 length:360 start_codon:yes stop_codon:yes gene_type:complete